MLKKCTKLKFGYVYISAVYLFDSIFQLELIMEKVIPF